MKNHIYLQIKAKNLNKIWRELSRSKDNPDFQEHREKMSKFEIFLDTSKNISPEDRLELKQILYYR